MQNATILLGCNVACRDNQPYYEFIVESFRVKRLYVFASENGRYTLNIQAADKAFEKPCLYPEVVLYWERGALMIRHESQEMLLFDPVNGAFIFPEQLFEHGQIQQPFRRTVLILDGEQELVAPFFDKSKVITYTDEWDSMPMAIPADIIVIGAKKFPINDILLRLPSNINAVVLHSEKRK